MRYFTLGGWTTETKVCIDITMENYKIFVNNFFEILTSQKKSQLISAVCLHFFPKNKNFKMIYTFI